MVNVNPSSKRGCSHGSDGRPPFFRKFGKKFMAFLAIVALTAATAVFGTDKSEWLKGSIMDVQSYDAGASASISLTVMPMPFYPPDASGTISLGTGLTCEVVVAPLVPPVPSDPNCLDGTMTLASYADPAGPTSNEMYTFLKGAVWGAVTVSNNGVDTVTFTSPAREDFSPTYISTDGLNFLLMTTVGSAPDEQKEDISSDGAARTYRYTDDHDPLNGVTFALQPGEVFSAKVAAGTWNGYTVLVVNDNTTRLTSDFASVISETVTPFQAMTVGINPVVPFVRGDIVSLTTTYDTKEFTNTSFQWSVDSVSQPGEVASTFNFNSGTFPVGSRTIEVSLCDINDAVYCQTSSVIVDNQDPVAPSNDGGNALYNPDTAGYFYDVGTTNLPETSTMGAAGGEATSCSSSSDFGDDVGDASISCSSSSDFGDDVGDASISCSSSSDFGDDVGDMNAVNYSHGVSNGSPPLFVSLASFIARGFSFPDLGVGFVLYGNVSRRFAPPADCGIDNSLFTGNSFVCMLQDYPGIRVPRGYLNRSVNAKNIVDLIVQSKEYSETDSEDAISIISLYVASEFGKTSYEQLTVSEARAIFGQLVYRGFLSLF